MSINMMHLETEMTKGIIADISGDVLVQLDKNGFIIQKSPNFEDFLPKTQVGFFPLHITDLAARDYADFIKRHVSAAISGRSYDGWAEFPAAGCWSKGEHWAENCQHWYGLNVRPLYGTDGEIDGALGLLRSVQQLRSLESELRASSDIDPMTGLPNRRTFCSSVQRHLNGGSSPIVVLLAVDAMRALRFRYGQIASDEMLWGFATFLKTMALPDNDLGYLNNEQFGVLMPNTSPQVAQKWAKEIIETFAFVARSPSAALPKISASAGISPARFTADWSLREAEIGLILSRSSGGNQVSFAWPRQAA